MFSKAACDCFPLKRVSFLLQITSSVWFPSGFAISNIKPLPRMFYTPGTAEGLWGEQLLLLRGQGAQIPFQGEDTHQGTHPSTRMGTLLSPSYSASPLLSLQDLPQVAGSNIPMLTKPVPDLLKAISFSISHPEQNSMWIFFFSVQF